jgi:hypothetical protein
MRYGAIGTGYVRPAGTRGALANPEPLPPQAARAHITGRYPNTRAQFDLDMIFVLPIFGGAPDASRPLMGAHSL